MIKRILTFALLVSLGSLASAQSLLYPDRHSTNAHDGWISCQESANPNPIHGNSHWIRYDFGSSQALYDIIFWNLNHPDHLVNGLKNVIIETSTNGSTWTPVDTFTIPKAPASGFYQGVKGPDLKGVGARYLLITAIDNHGGGCFGLSEFRVYTQDYVAPEFVLDFNPCESDGLYQNLTAGIANNGTYSGPGVISNSDGTFNYDVAAVGPGTYTIDYSYSGGNMSADITVLPCTDPSCPDCDACDPSDVVTVNMNPIPSDTYQAHRVMSSGRVSSSGNVEFMGRIDVELLPGFEINQSGVFIADFRTCETNMLLNPSFENDLDNWQFNLWGDGTGSWNATTSNPWDGSKCIQVTTTTSPAVADIWEVNIRQRDHTIQAGKTYNVSFHARADGGNTMRYEVYVEEGSYRDYVDSWVTLYDHWSKYEQTFTADTTSNELTFIAQFGEYQGNYYIDQVKFIEVNEN